MSANTVRAWTEEVVIPTYLPAPPDKNPMFLEKRVYQGSSGRVYPLPFTDRIDEKPTPRKWKAVWIENEFLRAMVLPELGGRIHLLQDKTNGYDLIYRQEVIKPALVGLAGPWISGGIEFNWPQHHRPATFMPVDFTIEEHGDGAKTIWCGDHDPMARMKGMHGVCLRPGLAYLELKVRVHNRTPLVQTFLWWANVATRVHEGYQSFFPPDVSYVADHARRSMSEYPRAKGFYYGVNYGVRGRSGVPDSEMPAQFVPPHCRPESCNSDLKSQIPRYPPDDLSFYANIPVPTSYMCMGSKEDFFGGYDHKAQAGLVHIANHHISPGKKQWTWGNHEFGYAWDRNLTDADEHGEFPPYIEIMAGVFTDNQPDFSFLQPGETKSWSQYWYPIQLIGPAQHANLDAAISIQRSDVRESAAMIRLGVSVTRELPRARIIMEQNPDAKRRNGGALPNAATARPLARFIRDLASGKPFVTTIKVPKGVNETDLRLRVIDRDGTEVLSYQPKPRAAGKVPPPATEPPAPKDITSADELFVTGLHLEQYRHATRCPTHYWREALRRDPGDARCNNAMGLWHLKRGEFQTAERHFRKAIERLTRRNANPYDGEPFYNLGLCLLYQADAMTKSEIRISKSKKSPKPEAPNKTGEAESRVSSLEIPSSLDIGHSSLLEGAYAAFYKATWNQAWAGAAFHALAEMDCRRADWKSAAEHLESSSCTLAGMRRAMNLWSLVFRRRKNFVLANTFPRAFKASDPLDWWTRHQLGEPMTCDTQTLLDIALDYARAGFSAEAIDLLKPQASSEHSTKPADDPRNLGTAPLVHYYLGWLHSRLGDVKSALAEFKKASSAPADYCFPARLEEIAILETAMRLNPGDSLAPYYLGNQLYDRRRHEEAIRLWERSARLDPKFATVWRNLGIGYFNIRHQPAKARRAYDRAFRLDPNDARVLFERDQLWKRLGEKPAKRLRELERHLELVRQRDDLSIELCALYNQVGRHRDALALVSARHFQPWEGGEGGPLGQWVRSHLALGREALKNAERGMRNVELNTAVEHLQSALTAPRNLGEARHLLANQSDVHYWLGCACAALGDKHAARQHWQAAATFKGDFQEMSVRAFSQMTYYSALAWEELGQKARAANLFRDLLAYAKQLEKTPAKIDYFATSLPTMLLFDDDLQFRQETTALFLQAQAYLGLRQKSRTRALLAAVLRRDPNHALAADLAEELT